MSYDKAMNFLIFDGDPNGLIMGELSNWNGRVYKIARHALTRFAQRSDAQHTGIYFLFGKDSESNLTIYVGEAESMLSRLKQHINEHEEWSDCIVVISKDNHLNKAHVKRLEYEFYQMAVAARRFAVTNANVPTCSSVSEYDQAMLLEFIDHTKLLVNTLGYKAFEGIDIPASPPELPNAVEYVLKSVSKNVCAKGISVADGFTVLAGSKVSVQTTPSFSVPLQRIRNKLLANGTIDEHFVFTSDYMFGSPSTAAAVVLGANANGRTAWKNQQGYTLAAVEATEVEQV